ncbi:hypothetical protein ESCNG_270012 [Neisseria gonorrhoeae]|nr:hypothetical protein ESCNG_270012 [Neisseria gonorrhoeae]
MTKTTAGVAAIRQDLAKPPSSSLTVGKPKPRFAIICRHFGRAAGTYRHTDDRHAVRRQIIDYRRLITAHAAPASPKIHQHRPIPAKLSQSQPLPRQQGQRPPCRPGRFVGLAYPIQKQRHQQKHQCRPNGKFDARKQFLFHTPPQTVRPRNRQANKKAKSRNLASGYLVGRERFERSTNGLKVRCSTG